MRWSQDQLDAYQAKSLAVKQEEQLEPDPGPEWKLQSKIEKYLKENGLYFIHDRSRGANRAGQPDLVVAVHGGRTVWIELKSSKGRMDRDQILTRQMLLALGHEFYEIRSFKAFLGVVLKPCSPTGEKG
jgi:hypothetical protein